MLPLRKVCWLVCLADLQLNAATISGGGETITTTPVPRLGFSIKTESTPAPAEPEGLADEANTEPELRPAAPAAKVEETQKGRLKELVAGAERDLQGKRYDAAIAKLDEVDRILPGHAEVLNMRGVILASTGRHDEAVKLLQEGLRARPGEFWIGFNLGDVLLLQKKYREARAQFQALRKDPESDELLRFKIVLTYLLEKNDKAAKAEIDQFPFPSDTAAREFAMAAWDFAHDNPTGGKEWIKSAVRIFGVPGTDLFYGSLRPLGWVPEVRPDDL